MKTALKTIELISAINKIPFDTKAAINRFALTKIEPSIKEVVRILKSYNLWWCSNVKELNFNELFEILSNKAG